MEVSREFDAVFGSFAFQLRLAVRVPFDFRCLQLSASPGVLRVCVLRVVYCALRIVRCVLRVVCCVLRGSLRVVGCRRCILRAERVSS